MNRLKKYWIVFLSFLPLTAGAVAPLVIGGIAGIGVITGFSIFRSSSPVNMSEALNFFSSCWSCQMFADIMATMSTILPRIYSALGHTIIPFAIVLSAIWFAWRLLNNYMNAQADNPWSIANAFTTHMLKLGFVIALLLTPLPRMITEIAVEPIFNVGLSLNRVVVHDDQFDACVVATALADPVAVDMKAANAGAFSPKLRHNLTCELAGVHQMTGLGMTMGWTMMNMAFNSKYMHKIMWDIPIFPNVILMFGGLMIVVLFFMALLPIPMFFLEIFITLSMDLIMLPLMLLGWLFKGWKISLQGAGKTIRAIIDDIVSGTLGLAITGIFVSFAVMFLNSIFGDWGGANALQTALEQNDSHILMDALMLNNDSLITIILMGVFMAMFMTSIPALTKTFFKVEISTKFYDTTVSNLKTIGAGVKKIYKVIKN